MTEPIVRPGTVEDLVAIEPLWRELYALQAEQGMLLSLPRDAYALWSDALRPHLGRFACLFVAEAGAVEGFLAGRVRAIPRHLGGGTAGYISEVLVREEIRGSGTGRRLVEEAIAWFQAQAVARVELNVAVRNPRARRFYEQLGFVEHQAEMVRLAPPGPRLDDPA